MDGIRTTLNHAIHIKPRASRKMTSRLKFEISTYQEVPSLNEEGHCRIFVAFYPRNRVIASYGSDYDSTILFGLVIAHVCLPLS